MYEKWFFRRSSYFMTIITPLCTFTLSDKNNVINQVMKLYAVRSYSKFQIPSRSFTLRHVSQLHKGVGLRIDLKRVGSSRKFYGLSHVRCASTNTQVRLTTNVRLNVRLIVYKTFHNTPWYKTMLFLMEIGKCSFAPKEQALPFPCI